MLLLRSYIYCEHIYSSGCVHASCKRKKSALFDQASLGERDELVEQYIQVMVVCHTELIAANLTFLNDRQ